MPDEADAGNTLEYYVDDGIPEAVAAACEAAGTDDVNLLGYCFGGVLSLLSAARHPELPIRNLALMATPVDFDADGDDHRARARRPPRPGGRRSSRPATSRPT